MSVVYRVQSSSDQFFQYQLVKHHLTNAALIISEGAPEYYSIYINTDVKVYFIKSETVNLSALEDDLRLDPATRDTFKELGSSEFFI